jgi:hypothetical protein
MDRVRFGIFDLERASRGGSCITQYLHKYKSECRELFTRLDIIHMYRDWASDRVDLAYSILKRLVGRVATRVSRLVHLIKRFNRFDSVHASEG